MLRYVFRRCVQLFDIAAITDAVCALADAETEASGHPGAAKIKQLVPLPQRAVVDDEPATTTCVAAKAAEAAEALPLADLIRQASSRPGVTAAQVDEAVNAPGDPRPVCHHL